MSLIVTGSAQRNTKLGIKETFLGSLTSYKFLPQFMEGNDVMVSVQVNYFTLLATYAAFLTCVTITLEYSKSPSYIGLGLASYLLLLRYTTFPIGCLIACTLASSLYSSYQKVIGLCIVSGDKDRNTNTGRVHVGLDFNQTLTTASTKVLTLMGLYPLIYATIVCVAMISGIGLTSGPTHKTHGTKFNRGLQSKLGELLETPLTSVKGNQQPSYQYTDRRFRDYWRGTDLLITSSSAQRESDDIVRALGNKGSHVNGMKFNSATLIKSRYAPGSDIATVGTQSNIVAVQMLNQMSDGSVTAYPTLAVASSETLWWINARKPYIYFYVSNDPEFGFGFTGFKPAQGNTKVVGQCLASIQVTVPGPRYHQLIYGITG